MCVGLNSNISLVPFLVFICFIFFCLRQGLIWTRLASDSLYYQKADLEFLVLLTPTFDMLGLQACTTTVGSKAIFFKHTFKS